MRCALLLFVCMLVAAGPVGAVTVWTGAPIVFDQVQPGDRDVIVPGEVEITRDAFFGIYNAALESAYENGSPAGTRWAFASNNPGKTIAASAYLELSFASWVDAIVGNPLGMIGMPAVLHLVASDIYLDLTFTGWGARGAGGFAYVRSTVPEPGTAALTLLGMLGLAACGPGAGGRPASATTARRSARPTRG